MAKKAVTSRKPAAPKSGGKPLIIGGGQHGGPLHLMPQLPQVPGPGVLEQGLQRAVIELLGLAVGEVVNLLPVKEAVHII